MQEWLKNLLIAVGGGTVVLIGILTVFKSLLVKLFETGMAAIFDKNLEKFKNQLNRSTRAYEILLDREMRYYEKIESFVAEIVPLEHDLLYYLEEKEESVHAQTYETFKRKFERYVEIIKALKNETLVHQTYIPQDIFSAFGNLVIQMQKDISLWSGAAKKAFSFEYDKINYEECKETVDGVLELLSRAEVLVKNRLEYLSGED